MCKPSSIRLRKLISSKPVILSVHALSIFCMLPIIVFSDLESISIEFRQEILLSNEESNSNQTSHDLITNYAVKTFKFQTCTILWPDIGFFQLELGFILFGFLVSFLIPVLFMSIFYLLIILRLKSNSIKLNMQSILKQKDRRKITILVFLITLIYVLAYSPFWTFQMLLLTNYFIDQNQHEIYHQVSAQLSSLFQLFVYFNSALNPFLYAFISEIFRSSFKEAFTCHKGLTFMRGLFINRLFKRNNKLGQNRNSLDSFRFESTSDPTVRL